METKTAQHTPVPWYVRSYPYDNATIPHSSIVAVNEQQIAVATECSIREGSSEANAAYIVRACNAHNALLGACQAVVASLAASHLPNAVGDLLLIGIAAAEGE